MMASRPRRPGRLRREAFGVRRIPALSFRAVRNSHTAPEYGALQTLRAVRLRLCRVENRRALPSAMSLAALLFFSVLLVGCASPHQLDTASNRPFDFETDTFAFPNELTWTYEYDAQGKWTTHTRKPKPDYSQHCFVVARSTRQFYLNARFDPSRPVADQATYRRLIRRVVSSS